MSKIRYDGAFYDSPVGTFASHAAFCKAFGVGRHIKGHKPTVVKKRPQSVLFQCSLRSSPTPCLWSAMLFKEEEGVWELRQHNGGASATHNEASEPREFKVRAGHKVHGWDTVEQVQALTQNFAAAPRVAPRAALRSCLLDETENAPSLEGIKLCQVQGLKKRGGPGPSFNFGQFLEHLNKFKSRPANENEGFSRWRMC